MTRPAFASAGELTTGEFVTHAVRIGEAELSAFAGLTGDRAPLHTSDAEAIARGFQGRLAHGMLVASFYSTVLGCYLPGPNTIITSLSVDMLAPVYVGDLLTYRVAVERISEAVGSVRLALSAANERGQTVSRGSAVCVFK